MRIAIRQISSWCLLSLWGGIAHWMVASCTEAQTEQSPRVEDVEMTARCDGTPQRYLLVFPPKFQNHRETDLLFVLHGHGSDRWQAVRNAPAEFQAARDVAAARGILLVSPDYRARTSWMGPKAEADMLQILEELKARYKIRKVILLGASMGGSSVLTFAALHPRLVDGVVSENGTANHIEYDQFQDAIRESFGGTKEQIPDEYKKRSAELWPERLSMPVAITAGGQDKLVPPESVVRLARSLERQNPATKLIYHEQSGHSTTYEDSRSALEFVLDAAKRDPFTIETRADRLVITAEPKPVADFVFRDEKILRPHFANVHAPGGTRVTRNHPPDDGSDATDHDTMHPGIWLGFGDINGVDFWRNKGRVEHRRFVEEPAVGPGRATFATESELLTPDGKSLGRLINRITLADRLGAWIILWDAEFTAVAGDLVFGDQEEMGFGARVATPFTEKNGGLLTSSTGRTTAAKTWGQPAAWCDYSGTVEGRRAGLTLMGGTGNFRESWWHNRDYGVFVANPFGREAMKQGAKSVVTARKGEQFRLVFGAVAHDTGYNPATAFEEFSELAKQPPVATP